MGPKRKEREPTSGSKSDELTDKRRDTRERSLTPLLIESDEEGSVQAEEEKDADAEEEEEKDADAEEEEDADAESEEGGLSQEEEEFLSQGLFQGNKKAEKDAINGLVDEVEQSQSQSQAELSLSESEFSQSQSQSQAELSLSESEFSQSQSQVIQAIESHNCDRDEEVVQQVQQLENRLINPTNAEDRIAQLYLELLRSSGENIQRMLENLKLAIQRMMDSTTATAMFEQINEHVVPLVRTVATTCVGYYLGSYLLRYVGGIISNLLARHTTITLISLGSAGVHIVYNVGTIEGAALLDQAVAAVNANIEIFLAGVNRIRNIQTSTHQIMRESTLNAVRANVKHAIAQVRGEYQENEMTNILDEIDDLILNDSEFLKKITEIQYRLNKLMAPVEVAGNNNNDKDEEHFGGKRVKRNRTKKTKAKKTVKRKAKKVKKTKKAKKAKKAKKTKKAKST